MNRRLTLQAILEKIPGVNKVYFQPPPTVQMIYPCIRYSLSSEWSKNADDIQYVGKDRYTVTVISSDPDTPIIEEVRKIRFCSFDRAYPSNNLYHFVFTLYF